MAGHPYKRILLKISGESLSHEGQLGIEPETLMVTAQEIVDVARCGVQVAVVVGGGNLIRGEKLARSGKIQRATADYMGMLGTVMNALALQDALEALGQPARVVSAIAIAAVCEPFVRRRVIRHLEKNRVVILAAGTGNPFVTTDTCATLRAAEIGADIVMKATKVDGVYDSDPKLNPAAKRYEKLTYADVLRDNLRVMDMTAISMAMEQKMPILVFNVKQPGNIMRAIAGEPVGTLVS
ncbi:MAG: UMP kinase [Phycisphaerae bacterium]|jgi:uridylate kinase